MNSGRAKRARADAITAVLAVCVCGWPVLAASPRLAPGKVRQIEQAISAEMGREKIPGLSVSVAQDLELVWSGGFGVADLENSVPVRTSTMFRLGSICKPITAVAVMQLAERGKLDLDAPIQDYVPSFPQKPERITARELLAHLAGIRHYRDLAEVNSTRHYANLTEPLRIFDSEPLLFEPGTKFSYTSYGYNLLGAAVEGASGMNFVSYLRAHVFAPAGMDRIRPDDVYDIIPHRARGYRKSRAGVENCALADTSNKIPAGGMIATAEDLVKFAVALERGFLLKKQTVEQMFTPQKTSDGNPVRYGLGWWLQEVDGQKWVSHSGAQQGVSTYLLILPADGSVVAIMANMEGLNLGPLSARIARVLLR